MAVWTEELKKQAIEMYEAGEPTAENSTELVKEIAEELDQSQNGVRQVLVQAKVYVKKEVATAATKPATKTSKSSGDGEGTKRVSKESQLAELRAAIEARSADVDEDILAKLTGKAAAYFTQVLGTK